MNIYDKIVLNDDTGRTGQIVKIVSFTTQTANPTFDDVTTETVTEVHALLYPHMKVEKVNPLNMTILDKSVKPAQKRAPRTNGDTPA